MNPKHMDDETRTKRSDIKKNEDKLKNHTFINAQYIHVKHNENNTQAHTS